MEEVSISTQALEQGEWSRLEELAQEAGYTERFNVLDTRLMGTRPLRFSLGDTNDDFEDERFRLIYFSAPYSSNKRRSGKRINPSGESPRTDWNQKYKDHFTLIKRDGQRVYFADCWQPKNSGNGIALMVGEFDERDYDFLRLRELAPQYSNLDEETKRVLHLADLREHYPPLSIAEILKDTTPRWIIPRVFFGGPFLAAAIGGLSQGKYLGAGFAGLLTLSSEFMLNHWNYSSSGYGYFNNKGVVLGEKAVRKLISEANS